MVKRYPEVARTDYYGRKHKFGQRHNACPNSLVYQKYAKALAEELAKRYGNNKNIVCWHVNNEYGGECYCESCEKAFRVWLRKKYKTIEALNKAWNMEFWGHTIYDWDETVLPNALSEGIGRIRLHLPEYPLITAVLTPIACWRTLRWNGMLSANMIPIPYHQQSDGTYKGLIILSGQGKWTQYHGTIILPMIPHGA